MRTVLPHQRSGSRPGAREQKEGMRMGQSIRDLMTPNPCSIDADKSVAYAAKLMRDEDVGLAPIVEGDKLVGTVTDRDIAVRVVAEGKDPESTKVKDIASIHLLHVDPRQDLDQELQT